MRKHTILPVSFFLLVLYAGGCAISDYSYQGATYEKEMDRWTVLRALSLDRALEDRVLALDPEDISEKDVREVLSRSPAPRIINIHGGIFPVHLVMTSFSEFLISMGYPEEKIRDPRNGAYSYSCYESSRKLAGLIAWYYEKEGMSPIIIGHSQGGIQAVKVLHALAGTFGDRIPVWNPVTGSEENRHTIIETFTGIERPVVGLQVVYATAVGAGGLTRVLPNQWNMLNRLRIIPDSVGEFTGFSKSLDLLGGDFLGFGPANDYRPNGTARVRNVRLPVGYSHVTVAATRHLAESPEIREWINSYSPADDPEVTVEFESPSTNILWAAEVWHSIKKHWAREARRLILQRRDMERWRPTS